MQFNIINGIRKSIDHSLLEKNLLILSNLMIFLAGELLCEKTLAVIRRGCLWYLAVQIFGFSLFDRTQKNTNLHKNSQSNYHRNNVATKTAKVAIKERS